jgi:DNA-binding MarR family transcriptional regulator
MEVARAARRVDMAMAELHLDVAGRMEMTQAELLALAHLGIDGELGPSELSRRLHLHSGAVTALLDRLADHGHIVREPHPSDRRRVVVRLTDRGRADTMTQLGPMVGEVVAMVERLPQKDRTTVGRFLDELATLVADRPRASAG